MESDNEEYFDEDLDDYEWPDDYFDEEINKVEEKVYRPKTPPYISQTPFTELTQDVLRRIVEPLELADRCRLMRACRQLKEAVEHSRWNNLGNGKLIVSTFYKPDTGLIVHVTFGNIITVKSIKDDWQETFTKLHRSFDTLHLKELRLNKVSLEHPLLQPVNDFIDAGLSFDKLSFMRFSASPITDREWQLIARAKREVVFDVQANAITEEHLLSFTRPVTLNIVKEDNFFIAMARVPEYMPASEELFLALVRRGHSLIKFEIASITVEALARAIETISSSSAPQICKLRLPYAIGRSYVEAFDVPRIYGPHERADNYASYLHLGATILLNHSPRRIPFITNARGTDSYLPAAVVVSSKGHPLSTEAILSPF